MKIGVLGAGQLGRMLALAGYPLGAHFVFLDRNSHAPTAELGKLMVGGFDQPERLAALAGEADVLTFDVENIPAEALRAAGVESLCRPGLRALETAQDRLAEKRCFQSLQIEVAPYRTVDSAADLRTALKTVGYPAVLKTRRLGYDGRGQRFIQRPEQATAALHELGGTDLILEGFVPFEREVSLLGVRSPRGAMAFYPLSENHHAHGILRLTRSPAPHPELAATAREKVERLLVHLDYVGVLAVEFFESKGRLIANEMAPRVHNSGHWSIEGAVTSQFENHVRAILDLPLGKTDALGSTAMVNLIGQMPALGDLLSIPGLHLHTYGKAARARRKLGHATLVAPDDQSLDMPLKQLLRLTARQS